MSTDPIDGHPDDAEIIELHPGAGAAEPAGGPAETAATVVPEEPGTRRDIIPAPWKRANLGASLTHHTGLHWHRSRYHGVRVPMYAAKTVLYTILGVSTLSGMLMRWWHWTDGWFLESQAVAAGRPGHGDAMRAHTQGLKTRGTRGRIVAVCAGVSVFLLLAGILYLPGWAWLVIGAITVSTLVYFGKPAGKPLAAAAVVPSQYAEPTQDIILDAFAGLGIPLLTKAVAEGTGITFITPIHRDGPGWCVQIDLPKGVKAVEVIEKRENLASGLRRPLSATWPATVPDEHPGRVELWIGFKALNKQAVGKWPLLSGGQTSLFEPVPFGGDQRIKAVSILLMFASVLIGSKPRMGKTMALRILALAAALDPTARIRAWELKGTGDLSCLEPVAHEYGSGADDGTLDGCLASVRKVYGLLDSRAKTIRELPKEQAPENKVTPQLSARRSLGLFPEVLIIDECQEAFSDDERKAEFEKLTMAIAKRGPALGIILMLATQRPDANSLPTGVASNMGIRFCLRVLGFRENNMILGDGMSKNGYSAQGFAESDKGIGYLTGADGIDDPIVVRTYYLNAVTADRIGLRARALREAAGTLSGYALGEQDDVPDRDFLADVLRVFDDEANLWSETIAARLAERLPQAYDSSLTKDSVSSQLRRAGVTVKGVREPGKANRAGCARADVARLVPVADVADDEAPL